MNNHRIWSLVVFTVAVFLLWQIISVNEDLPPLPSLPDISAWNDFERETEHQPATPPPLLFEEKPDRVEVEGVLSAETIWRLGNEERVGRGLTALERDPLLDEAARLKAEDMFRRQYFAHDSPDGEGVEQLVLQVGYSPIAIGENLAWGNFQDEAELIAGWMNSPGHRENILGSKYRQIGIAVEFGRFQERDAWMAVQVFGTPRSFCPLPDPDLEMAIDHQKRELNDFYLALRETKETLEARRPRHGEDYRRAIDEYNSLAEEYNRMVAELKQSIDVYNQQIRSFNQCLESL